MDETLYFNGIDGDTGDYLIAPHRASELAVLIAQEPRDSETEKFLAVEWQTASSPSLGLPFDVEPSKVSQAGWALVFHRDESQSIKDKLSPLVEHRAKSVDPHCLKILEYRDGERYNEWLARNGVSPGTVDPRKVPYYLLFVGDPQRIPFGFVHLLDVEYAVGYLHFDEIEEYGRYVESVIEYETNDSVTNSKEAVFFATRHHFDKATQYSADLLVRPLAEGVPERAGQLDEAPIAARVGFSSRFIHDQEASKVALEGVLAPRTGTRSPAFLFSATHGFGYKQPCSKQKARQGALVCQEWPGLGAISANHYFSADDLPADAKVHGMIQFHFACYGAGTPSHDRFFHRAGDRPPKIASEPFLAALPKALLSHRNGGALACIGHVDRAFSYSFVPQRAGPQRQPFANAIGRILLGEPVGHAVRDFNERYAALSTSLAAKLEELGDGAKIPPERICTDWLERNDAEGYLVVGDPAVRLRSCKLAERDA